MRRITTVLIDAGRVLLHPDDTLFQHAAHTLGQDLAPGAARRAIGLTVWEGAAADNPVAFWNTHRKIHAWARHVGLTIPAGTAVWQRVHRQDAATPLWSVPEPTAPDVTLAYHTAGEPGNPPMILLHGLGDSSADWHTVLPDLATTHHVHALDLRGHGDSSHPGAYSFELMRDDVLAFLDATGIDTCVLVGHSMGGIVAALTALTAPHRLTHLVLEDSGLPRPGSLPRPPLDPPTTPTPFDFAAVDAIRAQLNDPDPDWFTALAGLHVPTLIIGGAESPIPHDLLADSAARIPDATLVTVTAGHDVHIEQPTAFVTEITHFLNHRQPPPTATDSRHS